MSVFRYKFIEIFNLSSPGAGLSL